MPSQEGCLNDLLALVANTSDQGLVRPLRWLSLHMAWKEILQILERNARQGLCACDTFEALAAIWYAQ